MMAQSADMHHRAAQRLFNGELATEQRQRRLTRGDPPPRSDAKRAEFPR